MKNSKKTPEKFIPKNKELTKRQLNMVVEYVEKDNMPTMVANRKYKGIRDLPRFNKNPYVKEYINELRTGYSTTRIGKRESLMIHEPDSDRHGEIVSQTIIKEVKIIEKASFIKLFHDEIERIYALPKNAAKVFQYICDNLVMNSDEIYLWTEDMVKTCGYTDQQQVNKALVTLTEYGFIAPTPKPYLWFINVNIFFMGDRLTLIKDVWVNRANMAKELENVREAKELSDNSDH